MEFLEAPVGVQLAALRVRLPINAVMGTPLPRRTLCTGDTAEISGSETTRIPSAPPPFS